MPTLAIRGPDGKVQEQEVSGELTIGRADNNDLILVSGGVSRRHARVFLEDGQVMVEDTGSANGTFLDGERIKGAVALGPGAKLAIGDYELSLKAGAGKSRGRPGSPQVKRDPPVLGGGGAPVTRTLARSERKLKDSALLAGDKGRGRERPRPAPRVEGEGFQGPHLRGLTGPWANQVFPLRGKMQVGRVAGVALQIDDDSVSRRHAELEATKEGVLLRDLGSANGTAINGAPLQGEQFIHSGDVVQFGVVELEYQNPSGESVASARAPGGRRGALGVVMVLLILAAGGAAAVKFFPGLLGGPRGPTRNPEESPELKVMALLEECRSYASADLNNEPNWAKAEAACNAALDLDPINPEANELIRRIKFEQENASHFDAAERAMRLDREEEALDAYAKIVEGSAYFSRVKSRIGDAIEKMLKKSKDDCDRYARNSEWRPALERCEKYMQYRCQNLRREDLVPPPGYKARLDDSGRLKRNEWRPPDPMYRKFLRVRAKVDPGAPQWECPHLKILNQIQKQVDPEVLVEKELSKRFQDRLLRAAMLSYWEGRDNEANTIFLKLQEDVTKADLHRQTEEIRRDAAAVASLFKAGQTALQQSDVEEAAKVFEEAMGLDAKLMGDLAESHPSFWRTNIGVDLAEKSYEKGKYFADREDGLHACKVWKKAFELYKGNPDLNRAIGWCTNQAMAAFDNAGRCEDLTRALALAVPGDGLEERVQKKKAELGCK